MIVIYILVGFGILYGIAAILKHKSDKQEDEEMIAALHKFHRNMSNQEKYEALKKQYEILANPWREGDVLPGGWSIPTTKEWKVTAFISLSFDLEFISYIGKK